GRGGGRATRGGGRRPARAGGGRGGARRGARARGRNRRRSRPVRQRDQAVRLDAGRAGVVRDAGPGPLLDGVDEADAARAGLVPVAVAVALRRCRGLGAVLGGGCLARLCHVIAPLKRWPRPRPVARRGGPSRPTLLRLSPVVR